MKHFFITILLVLTASSMLCAQNNAYEIDDECYQYYMKAESLVGETGFWQVNQKLLSEALAKNDKKAETLYYVEFLKNEVKTTARDSSITGAQKDLRVETARDNLIKAARKYGFKQYYYYSYDLVKNYYFNSGREAKAIELVLEMQNKAIEEGDDYGIWTSYRYLVQFYMSLEDYPSARKNILKSLEIFNTTDDETIRRQSATRLYCDLADTYPVNSDSMRLYIDEASRSGKQHLDTLRWKYYKAIVAALDKDRRAYFESRDYCINDDNFHTIKKDGLKVFSFVDNFFEGRDNYDLAKLDSISIRGIKFIANIAEVWGERELAFQIEKEIVTKLEKNLASANNSRISELDAQLGNNELSANLADKTLEVVRQTRIITILLTLVLLGALGITVYEIRQLKKHRAKDAKMIEHLKEANEKALIADAAKTRFVQNMSHEVRTPLNAIVGFSQLLSLPDGSFTPEEKDEFSGHIINNTKMLTMLLDDILSTSSMDSGNYKITIEDGEAEFMCRAAISSAEHRLQPGVTMFFEAESETPFNFRTDPRRVQQIIINLLTNACKHTTKGEIKLAFSLSENPGEVTFSVTDTGPGVPADQAEKIFDRFTKLNDFVQGTGLGLSICRDIAGKMGGRVYLDTTYDKGGARFVFVLPVTPPQEEALLEAQKNNIQ